jgi:hypothetical protein
MLMAVWHTSDGTEKTAVSGNTKNIGVLNVLLVQILRLCIQHMLCM